MRSALRGGDWAVLSKKPAGGGASDELDLLRAILYVGTKIDEHWLINSEFEFEHASTGADGEVSVEFLHLEYLHRPELNFRGGLVLVPMGFVNELHEPTTFLSAARPVTEQRILPSTWRENGLGVFGSSGSLSYRTYVLNGFDATGFSSAGLRGGRQKGSKALAEDLAWVGRLDWEAVAGLTLGASAYLGKSGQNQDASGGAVPDTNTSIGELHAEWRGGGFAARALLVRAELDDVSELNSALGLTGTSSIGERLEGGYVELGYDVLTALAPVSNQSLTPFVRFETLDTQAEVPGGFASNPSNDQEIMTMGIQWKPVHQVVVKADYEDRDRGADQWNLLVGYVF